MHTTVKNGKHVQVRTLQIIKKKTKKKKRDL